MALAKFPGFAVGESAVNASPFQAARWALFAGFGVMVAVVSLPNPSPSAAWKIAETNRYLERFPQLRRRENAAQPKSEVNLAEAAPAEEQKPMPYRTAHLPDRLENKNRRPASSPRPGPLIEQPASKKLPPDPVHLDPPTPTGARGL